MHTNNTENKNTPVEINKEEENYMEFLKAQNKITVIDIPEQEREAEKAKEKDKNKHVLIYKQFFILRVYTTAVIAYLLYIICNIGITIITNSLFGDNKESSTNQKKLVNKLEKVNVYYIIYVCVVAPIIEEFIFRSILFKLINWAGKKVQEKVKFIGIIIRILAFLISSFIFAFGHFSFSFELLKSEIRTFPSYFLMGLIFAYAYNRDNYLLASIFTHMINNIIATIAIYVLQNNELGMISLSIIKCIFKSSYF